MGRGRASLNNEGEAGTLRSDNSRGHSSGSGEASIRSASDRARGQNSNTGSVMSRTQSKTTAEDVLFGEFHSHFTEERATSNVKQLAEEEQRNFDSGVLAQISDMMEDPDSDAAVLGASADNLAFRYSRIGDDDEHIRAERDRYQKLLEELTEKQYLVSEEGVYYRMTPVGESLANQYLLEQA